MQQEIRAWTFLDEFYWLLEEQRIALFAKN
jgi:hypothetical protein